MKLYSIPGELETLLNSYESLLVESQGEVTDEVAIVEDEIKTFCKAASEHVEACAAVLLQLDADAEILASEVKRLNERKRGLESNRERLAGLVSKVLDLSFDGKIKTPMFTVFNADSKGATEVTIEDGFDAYQLASEHPGFFKAPEIRKSELLQAVKGGAKIPEGLMITSFPGKRSLRIK